MCKLVLLFLLVPLLELWLLIEVGRALGTWPTIILVFLTGFIGVLLARLQGLAVLRDIHHQLAKGLVPTAQMFDGLLILIGGLLLISPGLATDTAGFLLLFPVTRNLLKERLRKWVERKLKEGALYLWYR
ncbi:MAG TPA: FxsA family protein [Bacillota bacterium]|nr:FxsA family protein [Bacillota bacterium]HOP69050.1 FxsA family protein [Bacillota bacterium]HPT33682.1 FxsA family protein [Bacillota bacterium]HQD06497.1 FxsA family protein [Bacillota bacterium]